MPTASSVYQCIYLILFYEYLNTALDYIDNMHQDSRASTCVLVSGWGSRLPGTHGLNQIYFYLDVVVFSD